jgi:hypothetical protein
MPSGIWTRRVYRLRFPENSLRGSTLSQVFHIPFSSIQRMKTWFTSEQASLYDQETREDLIFHGFMKMFKSQDPVLRVWEYLEFTENTRTVDVHVELEDVEGQVHQFWILTLTNVAENAAFTLEELEDPFPFDDVFWGCEFFTIEEVIKAVTAWSQKFWTDWHPEVRWEITTDGLGWLKDLIRDALGAEMSGLPPGVSEHLSDFSRSRLYLIENLEERHSDLEAWIMSKGQNPILRVAKGLIVQCVPEFVGDLEQVWSVKCSPLVEKDR